VIACALKGSFRATKGYEQDSQSSLQNPAATFNLPEFPIARSILVSINENDIHPDILGLETSWRFKPIQVLECPPPKQANAPMCQCSQTIYSSNEQTNLACRQAVALAKSWIKQSPPPSPA